MTPGAPFMRSHRMSGKIRAKLEPPLGKPSLQAWPSPSHPNKRALALGVCSLQHGHHPSEAEHLLHHHPHLSAAPPLPAHTNAELFISTLFQHRDKGRFQLHGFVVMPDHVHILITPAIDQSTARCIQFIKGGYSFAVRNQSPGEIWHSGCHEHRIRDDEDFDRQMQYIANNPARKQYENYLHLHTRYLNRLDSMPDYLQELQGLKPLSVSAPRARQA